eukprot:CAMPEP_0172865578 /NCGR_PEP_ID=MMETSP1075-20121228/81487_1 /TAXON_ID=2916 /ORGANISM="Ceratium fusus, Strain PA161109" /LENGTH=100 /DNA_ID=CAMNT_0013714631 /DNA_START=252 /DNA_END=551 /DNA_ORIENTATION=-
MTEWAVLQWATFSGVDGADLSTEAQSAPGIAGILPNEPQVPSLNPGPCNDIVDAAEGEPHGDWWPPPPPPPLSLPPPRLLGLRGFARRPKVLPLSLPLGR